MRVIIELNSGDVSVYNKNLLSQIAQEVIECSHFFKSTDDIVITISIAFVSSEDIQRINRRFRGKDQETDVISVGDYSDEKDILKEKSGDIFLGEIILCYNYIVQSAKENQISVDREFFTVYAHGILHLLGFDHGEKMFTLQDNIAKKFSD
ncbi:MAG: rRNA maturation RNase YbeY [Candidatus Moraniibacteriota bacterium]|nr:MAG: rRNA maturation RNase YbeY [Candidatus Moranbacteria bacterium]